MTGMWLVVVASPYPAMRAGWRALLAPAKDLSVVGEAATADEVLGAAEATRPNVVLYDLDLESGPLLNTLWRLRHAFPDLAVLVVARSEDDPDVLSALQAGASGYVSRTVDGPALAEALRTVAAGGSVLAPRITAALLDQLRGDEPAESLTPRETQVLEGVSAGLTNKAIAQKLGISEHTVKFHLGSAMGKLAAASRAEAVATAIRRGLISV